MRYSLAFAALAAIAKAQDATPTSWDLSVPTNPADALDLAAIEAIPDPTFTEIPNLKSQVVSLPKASAISDAIASINEEPLTVFPAATSIAQNAEGEATAAAAAAAATATAVPKKRSGANACQANPVIPNVYNVDLTSYDSFKNDAKISSVASAAAASPPAGYYTNSVNLKSAQSAYAYLGYDQFTTYDVAECANRCNKKAGCLSFNMYFERAPVVVPGYDGECEKPEPFANIKCSYWGSVLEDKTATNSGQMQSQFETAIAGSNSYTNRITGGPIAGCTDPLFLNTTVMNAPLRDCATTWTYMGYKLYTDSAYNPEICKAACDAQTKYNLAHPPSTGKTPTCAGFGSYLLTKNDKTGSYPQGQMCTLYTSGWGKQYGVNRASYDDRIGANFTYTASFFYNVTALQPSCLPKTITPSRMFRI